MASKNEKRELVSKVLTDFGDDKNPHDEFVEKADRCYRSYKAILEFRSEAASWTNKQHPAYVLQSIETMAASLLNTSPLPNLKPIPVLGSFEEMERAEMGAKANEILLRHQICTDKFAEKQRTFDLQALITGLTASKQFWKRTKGKARYLESYQRPDLYGRPGEEVGYRPGEKDTTLKDDPTSEVLDVRHLVFHNGAASIQNCDRITHICFYPYSKVKEYVDAGYWGPKAGGEPLPTFEEMSGTAQKYFQRENDLWGTQPHKDDVVIFEQWREGGKRVVTVGNESWLACDKPNPFWFDYLDHPFPFVVCSGTPDLFRIPGISEAELMAELQEMMWTLVNQRLDVTQLVANAISLIADDVEDPEAFEFAPGERWLVPRPVEETIKMWSPDIAVAQASLEAEQLLRGDIQNVTGGMPFLSGTDSGGVDQETATGVSIVTSLAQRRLAAKQQQFVWAKGRILEQWCALNQQYVRSPRLVPTIGTDGARAFEEIRPDLLQGRYVFETEMVNESLMRQEQRAEKQAFLQVFLQAVPVFAAVGMPLNPKAAMDEFLKSHDIYDTERFYSAMPQPAMAQPQQGGGPQAPPEGITNAALAAGPTAPSNEASMSPMAALQQMAAMNGGPANAGGSY